MRSKNHKLVGAEGATGPRPVFIIAEKMMMRIFICVFVILFLLNGMIGCTSNEILPIKEITPTSTIQPKITATVEMTPTLGKTVTKTWAPKSTLTETEKEEIISDLIETNGGCILPCWWGITPGKTKGSEALSFLEEFTKLKLKRDENGETGYLFTYQYLSKEYSISLNVDKNDNISYIITDNFNSISDTMEKLGTPNEVWFRADTPLYFSVPLVLEIYYPHEGIFVMFGDSGTQYYEKEKNIIKFCRSDLDKAGTFFYWWTHQILLYTPKYIQFSDPNLKLEL